MAAQTASSSASFGFLAHRQQPSGLMSPSDATVFFCASDVSTATTQNNKVNLFTRAHSLEIPDDNDLPMVDMDLELPDEIENLWLPEQPTEIDISTSNLDLDSVSNFVFNCELTSTRLPKPKRKRISTKQKIDTLRNEVKRLALQIQEMEKTGREREAQSLVQPMTCKLWQKIAQRQLSQRQSSEEENAKLRQMMGMQVREARNLRRMLTRRPKLEILVHTVREQCPEIEFPCKR